MYFTVRKEIHNYNSTGWPDKRGRFFLVLVKSVLSSVRYRTSIHWTSHFSHYQKAEKKNILMVFWIRNIKKLKSTLNSKTRSTLGSRKKVFFVLNGRSFTLFNDSAMNKSFFAASLYLNNIEASPASDFHPLWGGSRMCGESVVSLRRSRWVTQLSVVS